MSMQKRSHEALEAEAAEYPTSAPTPDFEQSASSSEQPENGVTFKAAHDEGTKELYDVNAIGKEVFEEGTANDLEFVSKFANLDKDKVTANAAQEADGIKNFDPKKASDYQVKKLKDMPLRDYNFDEDDDEEGVFKAENDEIDANADTKEYLSDLAKALKSSEQANNTNNPYSDIQHETEHDNIFNGNSAKDRKNKEASEKKAREAWDEGREETDAVPMQITTSVTQCGVVHAHCDGVVVCKGDKGSRALDLGSLLCSLSGEVLGKVCDTFGQIDEPHYLVFPTSGLLPAEMPEKWAVGAPVAYVDASACFAVDEDGNVMRAGDFITEMDDECSGDDSGSDEE